MTRRGFTLVELVVVLSVAGLLAGIATPSILRAMQRARVTSSAAAIEQAHAVAMGLARLSQGPETTPALWTQLTRSVASYGVAIDASADEAYVVVVYGETGDATDELTADKDGDGVQEGFVFRKPLRGVQVWSAAAVDGLVDRKALTGRLAWFYRYGTGEPIANCRQLDPANRPTGVGTPEQAAQAELGIATGNTLGRSASNEALRLQSARVPPSTVATHLSVRDRDGTMRVAVAIYQLGFTNAAEF